MCPPDDSILTWRISELERAVDQLRHDMTLHLEQQQVTNEAARAQIRSELATRYLTADQTQLAFIPREELKQATNSRRDYILYLVAIGQLALGLYVGLH